MPSIQIQTKRLSPAFTFSNQEKRQLTQLLATATGHPFENYAAFWASIQDIIQTKQLPVSFLAFIQKNKNRSLVHEPFIYIKNCPVDTDLPLLDWENPRASKLEKKKTFISEGFLILYAELMNTPTLAYRFGGNGDYIRDVHPQRSMQKSQSSLATTSFGFHKELPIRDTSPDFLRILGLRNSKANEILTTFIRNIDIINALDEETLNVLRSPSFNTPFTVLSVKKDKDKELGNAPKQHAILQGNEISYHEGRTKGITKAAKNAILKLNEVLKLHKQGVLLDSGDFVDLANKNCLHAKDVNFVTDTEALKQRWLIKTFNAQDLKTFEPYFVKDQYGMVNG